MNALLDYGTSSSSDTDEETSQNEQQSSSPENTKPKFPKPALGESSLHTSVFSNPFVEAELAKAAILEKHVKMVPGKDNTQMINGKKICWNYRKGKCRFGHNCKYAHDSDIQKTSEELAAEKQKAVTNSTCEGASSVTLAPPPKLVDEKPLTDDVWEGVEKKKKRPGLSQGLVPGKKVLKMYKEQKIKDAIKN